MGGALFYPSVKRSPCVLLFVCGWIAPAALWEKIGFCFFWPSKERNTNDIGDYPVVGVIHQPPMNNKQESNKCHRCA
jgi:hypothetical protein